MDATINVEELTLLRDTIINQLNHEKIEYENTNEKETKELIDKELVDITKELQKVEGLIEIYTKETEGKEYIVAELEKLYILNIINMDKDEYEKLGEEKRFEIFDGLFPNEWVLSNEIAEKEKILLDAIVNNKTLMPKES